MTQLFCEVKIRPYDPSIDSGYIYSTWTRSSFYTPKEPITVPKQQFFKEKRAQIHEILKTARVKIACLQEDPETIFGCIVYTKEKIEWLCVKKSFLNSEIHTLLLMSVKG